MTQDEDAVRVQVGTKGWEDRGDRGEDTYMVVRNEAIKRLMSDQAVGMRSST